jgi:hypothetical protein
MRAETLSASQSQTCTDGPPALLTLAMIRRFYVPAGSRTIWRWISCARFPAPDIAVGAKTRYWKRESIEAWIAAQTEGAKP